MDVKRVNYGEYRGKKVELIQILDPSSQFEVHLMNFGASINSVKIADRNGNAEHVHYGRRDLDEIVENPSFQGTIVGRVASLIAYGRFELDGKVYEVSKNIARVHCQHGGFEGFNLKVWDCMEVIENKQEVVVVYKYISKDGEEGFPGNLTATIKYIIEPMKISWEITATTDKPTIVNMTNHAYWNLDGIYKKIHDLKLQILASHYLDVNNRKIIFGTLAELLKIGRKRKNPMKIKPIKDLGIDITKTNKIGDILKSFGDIDHNFLLSLANDGKMKTAGTLYSPNTGRKLTIRTTEPNIVVYSGNTMEGLKSYGKELHNYEAICLETMKPTNSIQIPELRDWVIVRSESSYFSKTDLNFELDEK